MKKIILFLLLMLPALSVFADYAGLAREIESTSKNPEIRKIAVLPFEVISGSYAKGAEVQDELIFAFVRNTAYTVLAVATTDIAPSTASQTTTSSTMAQTADLYINEAKTGSEDLRDNYIQFDLYEFNMSLLGTKRWGFYELYGGASMGVGIGALILGNAFYIGDNFGILIEGRYTGLFAEWDRDGEVPPGIDEDMVLTLNGPMVLSGVSLRWE